MADVLHALGGLGVFLLGMSLLVGGLKELVRGALHRALLRLTRSPATGAIAGALVTAVVQSSSATTVAAVGFVGGGVISFADSLGIIFGANVGTTITGWLVALFGFKLELGTLLMPLILAGALMHLFGRPRSKAIGYAVAGFGLIFLGIASMQSGMVGFRDVVTPSVFPNDTFFGRIQLLGIGIVVTLVTQSSSAGVAAALAAVSVGSIHLPQAMAIVIGMNIGTAATAAIAAIGGTTAMRRTAVAHVVFNSMTAVMALLLLSPYLGIVERIFGAAVTAEPELCLVGFHTFFNLLGTIIVLPLTQPFGRLIEWLIVERNSELTWHLERGLLADPEAALGAIGGSLREVANRVLLLAGESLGEHHEHEGPSREDLIAALLEIRNYTDRVHTTSSMHGTYERYLSAMHTIDHLSRLLERLGQRSRIRTVRDTEDLAAIGSRVAAQIYRTRQWLDGAADAPDKESQDCYEDLDQQIRPDFRRRVLGATAVEELDAESAISQLDAFRWLDRVAYHNWRIVHHLSRVSERDGTEAASLPVHEPEPEVEVGS